MNNSIQDSLNFSRKEPIPGYLTTELLGRGGFGEVWQAVAPGGVAKAIKLVFSDDSTRADSELRSLNRIKDVRHPLILSIDRIEIVEGTLVIVTELGDCNLKEYFQQFRARGQLGIPQAELLKMLHNAAEALDFIYTEHSLQHLDVKPENFLVFGKHLKVADFGLVKHIYERSASMLHGLTPIYSAPELFEGKANRFSDQYSLAIVYQQMLTGQLPFDGLSAARLATQHLMEPPNLHALPLNQQPAIARALSKDPHQRFSSCVELIEELQNTSARKPDPSPSSRSNTSGRHCETGRSHEPTDRKVSSSQLTSDAESRDAQASDLCGSSHDNPDSILAEIDQDVRALSPTIVIGIGGTAANVMQNLRLRVNDRLGRLREAPAIQFILIDSEIRQLNELNRDKDVWQEVHTVATPLRKSEEYQSEYSILKRWINRRWLFNIPRDQSTGSIRPLGRLALVSNFQRVCAELDRALAVCGSEDSVSNSAKSLGLQFRVGKPRVVLLSSISGGTGGGMLLDLAYTIRGKLKQAGYSDNAIEVVMMHSTPNHKGRDQAIANAYATLQELEHYSQRGHYYPGDTHLGVDAFHGNNRTFRTVDIVHLGDHLSEADWSDATDDVAEYLFGSLLNSFHIARVSNDENRLGGRAISIRQLGASNRAFLSEFSFQVCVELFESWRGRASVNQTTASMQPTTIMKCQNVKRSSKFQNLTEALDEQLSQHDLCLDRLVDLAGKTISQEVGKNLEDYTRELVQESQCHDGSDAAVDPLAVIDYLLSVDEPDSAAHGGVNLFAALLSRAETQGQKIVSGLRGWLHGLVDDPTARVDGALFAAESSRGCIQDILSSVNRERSQVLEALAGLKLKTTDDNEGLDRRPKSWNPFRSGQPSKRQTLLYEYATFRVKLLALTVVYRQLRVIEAQIGVSIEQMQRLSHELTKLSSKFETRKNGAPVKVSLQPEDESTTWYVQTVRDAMIEKKEIILHELENAAISTLAESGHSLQSFLDSRIQLNDFLLIALREQARDVVSRTVSKVHCELINGRTEQEGLHDQKSLLPQLIDRVIQRDFGSPEGHDERYAIVIPESANSQDLEAHLRTQGRSIDVASLKTNGITLVQSINDVSLFDLASQLTNGAEIYQELASRLHTRDDVAWTPLAAWETSPEQEIHPPTENGEVDHTVALNS